MPYAFPVTASLSTCCALSSPIVCMTAFIMFNTHGVRAFSRFVPEGTPLSLLAFIVPIEVFSFLLRFISLPVRLFANIVSGHVLLKVFASLSCSLLATKTFFGFSLGFISFLIVVFLFFLEILIAFVQAYVFCLLALIYLNDAYRLN